MKNIINNIYINNNYKLLYKQYYNLILISYKIFYFNDRIKIN